MKQAMNWIYIAMTLLAIGFVVYANYASSNMHKNETDATEKPISQPADTIRIESDHMIYHEWDSYHGREGESEYGEYEPNKCLQLDKDAYNKWMDMQ